MEQKNLPYSDPLLDVLIRIIESFEEGGEEHPDMSITLNVGGMLITGDLISKDIYLKDFLGGAVLKAFQIAEEKDESLKQDMEEIDKKAKEKLRDFIHLKNTKFVVPGQPPVPFEKKSVLWRGRLSCVDGFIIGRLAVTVKKS